MSQYTYLLIAEGAEGDSLVFSAPDASLTVPGDLVMFDGQCFEVTSITHADTSSPEYALIGQLNGILVADAIYCKKWTKENSYV